MKYSTNVLTVFASLAVTSVSAQLPVDVTATTAAAPNTFDDSDKCPGPIGNNDKGCRCIPVEDYADLRGAILRMRDAECKCFGETSVLNGMNLLVSARLFNLRARTLLVFTVEIPAEKAQGYLLSQFY